MSRTKATLTGKRCQCPACGEYFSTVRNFDKHRAGSYAVGRYCLDPETVNLSICTTNAGTFWKGPARVFENKDRGTG